VSVARVSQIEHAEVTSFEIIARYVEALGGQDVGKVRADYDLVPRQPHLPVDDLVDLTYPQPFATGPAWTGVGLADSR